MHVLIVPSEHFVTSGYPVGGIFQFQQANALHNAGYRVGVIAPGVITSRFLFKRYDYPDFEAANGYPVYRRYVRKLYPQRWERPAKSIPFYQNLGLDIYHAYKNRFGKPDVVHAHNAKYAGFIAQVIKEADDVPFIITEHSSTFRTTDVASEWIYPIKKAIQQATAKTAVSQALANAIVNQIGVRDVEVLPNIVDSIFLESEIINRDNDSGCIFLNIASLDVNKNQSALIEAFARHFKGGRCRLRIGGTGPLSGQLNELARRLGIEDQVTFLGFLDRQSVLREMQAADCFVLSSRQETFGVVLVEALAAGRPVIATRCGGPEDIVNEENGLLVAPGDIAALGAAMMQMAQTASQYQPEALREDCRIRFGEKAFVANASRFYVKAMATPACTS